MYPHGKSTALIAAETFNKAVNKQRGVCALLTSPGLRSKVCLKQYDETLKKPARVLWTGCTRMYIFLPTQNTSRAIPMKIPGTLKAVLGPRYFRMRGVQAIEAKEPTLMHQ